MTMLTEPPELKRYSGIERAATLMLVLGKDHGAPIWENLSVEEIKELSAAMASLGRVPASVAEHLLGSFANEVSGMNSLHGSFETTERLLEGILPDDMLDTSPENWTSRCSTTTDGTRPRCEIAADSSRTSSVDS